MQQTKERIIELLRSTKRFGIERLISWLEEEGFFEAPASTRFHGAYPGGLAEHSLKVLGLLEFFAPETGIDIATAPGQKPLPVTRENLIIAGLLHDVCKVGAYIATPGGKNPYKGNREQPKGHGTLSIDRLKKFIELTPIEEMMIRFHMGIYGLNEFYKEDDWQQGEYPLRGDETKSKEERYGQSLANAWYHNPVVKLMYFCDELATLMEKKGAASHQETTSPSA